MLRNGLRAFDRLALALVVLLPAAITSAQTPTSARRVSVRDTASATATRRVDLVAAAPTVVLLVRHAERVAAPADDPPLSEAGAARARALVHTLADAGVEAIVVTTRIRTRATAQPLADSLRLAPEVVPVGGPTDVHARTVAAAVRRHAGRTVLVVGHSNTVPAIVAALGGPRMADICDAAFSNLFVLVTDPPGGRGKARFIRTHYGAADPEGAEDCAGMQAR